MALVSHLPLDVHLHIIKYLEYENQVDFACTTRSLCQQLLKNFIRKFSFDSYKLHQMIVQEPEKLQQILLKIQDPGRQISLYKTVNLPFFPSLDNHQGYVEHLPFNTIETLETTFQHFLQYYHPNLNKISKLILYQQDIEVISDDLLNNIYSVFNQNSYQINDLTLTCFLLQEETSSNSSFTAKKQIFPFFPYLQSLKLYCFFSEGISSSYHSLHYLELSTCPNISDVSSLGNIHTLILRNCGSIKDITPLKNNYSITIDKCASIRDYSNCFNNSYKITIALNWSDPFSFTFSYHHYEKMTYLSLTRGLPLHDSNTSIIERLGRLRELILKDNEHIKSLQGFGNISILRLENLNRLKRLDGLTPNNNTVEITNCPITKYLPLKQVKHVILRRMGVETGDFPVGLNDLTIDSPFDQVDIDRLRDTHRLSLVRCNNIRAGTARVHTLEVDIDQPSISVLNRLVQSLLINNHIQVVIFKTADRKYRKKYTDFLPGIEVLREKFPIFTHRKNQVTLTR